MRFGHVLELVDLNLALGEDGFHLQLPTHRLDEITQSRDVHIRSLFHLRNRPLVDLEDLGEVDLGQATGFAQLVKRHDRSAMDGARGHSRRATT